MLGVALGDIGLSLESFDALSLPEFASISEAYGRKQERENMRAWETARFIAMFMVQPYSKKKLTIQDICQFSWDKNEKAEKKETTQKGVDEMRKRYKELSAKMG